MENFSVGSTPPKKPAGKLTFRELFRRRLTNRLRGREKTGRFAGVPSESIKQPLKSAPEIEMLNFLTPFCRTFSVTLSISPHCTPTCNRITRAFPPRLAVFPSVPHRKVRGTFATALGIARRNSPLAGCKISGAGCNKKKNRTLHTFEINNF